MLKKYSKCVGINVHDHETVLALWLTYIHNNWIVPVVCNQLSDTKFYNNLLFIFFISIEKFIIWLVPHDIKENNEINYNATPNYNFLQKIWLRNIQYKKRTN